MRDNKQGKSPTQDSSSRMDMKSRPELKMKMLNCKTIEKKKPIRDFRKLQTTCSSASASKSTRRSSLLLTVGLLSLSVGLLLQHRQVAAATSSESNAVENQEQAQQEAGILPANHRAEPLERAASSEELSQGDTSKSKGRRGRQYDVPMGTSSTGNYAAFSGAGNDAGASTGAYSSLASATNNNALNYASELPLSSNGMYSTGGGGGGPAYGPIGAHDGYAGRAAGAYPAVGPYGPPGPPLPAFGHGGPLGGGLFGGGGSSSSGIFPLMMAKGFDVSEIVCTAIAVAIGAVIVGAPFILLYLFIMNQMQGGSNGGGPSAMGPGGGSISLTGPSASTNVSGRKKRHTSLPEALFRQLSPLVNSEQVAQTFKALMNSLAHYQA